MNKVTLTIPQVASMFGVTPVTIFNWRKGTRTLSPMPTVAPKSDDKRQAVGFALKDLKTWAKKHGLIFKELEASPLTQPASKAGPKPRAKAEVPVKTVAKKAGKKVST